MVLYVILESIYIYMEPFWILNGTRWNDVIEGECVWMSKEMYVMMKITKMALTMIYDQDHQDGTGNDQDHQDGAWNDQDHQDGAVLASLLILLVFRSWSRIFFSISASVNVSKNGHHWSASDWLRMATSTTGNGVSLNAYVLCMSERCRNDEM